MDPKNNDAGDGALDRLPERTRRLTISIQDYIPENTVSEDVITPEAGSTAQSLFDDDLEEGPLAHESAPSFRQILTERARSHTLSSGLPAIMFRPNSTEDDLEALEKRYTENIIASVRIERGVELAEEGRSRTVSHSPRIRAASQAPRPRAETVGGFVEEDEKTDALIALEEERVELEAAMTAKVLARGVRITRRKPWSAMYMKSFWTEPRAFQRALDVMFRIEERGGTIRDEFICGLIHFMACVYIIPVLPGVMNYPGGYDPEKVVFSSAAMMALGNTVSAFVTNLPFVISPVVPIGIFMRTYLQANGLGVHEGSVATIWAGVLLCIIGSKPFAIIFFKLVPHCLQAAIATGIGFLIALSGMTEIGLIMKGKNSLLEMPEIGPEMYVGLGTVVLIGVLFQYRIKGAFVVGLIFGSVVEWARTGGWPTRIVDVPSTIKEVNIFDFSSGTVTLLFSIFGLQFALLIGLTRAFADLSHLADDRGRVPRARLLFIVCGIFSIISGLNSGFPMVLSNETPVGLKNGAKTGLSVLVSALCFLVLCFVGPLFANIPHAGTMPLLFTIGVFLVANARKIEWNVMSDALPAFFIIFIIPFSQNLLRGSMFGFIVYAMMAVCCGHMRGYIEEYLHAVKEEMLALFGIEKKGDDIDNGKGGVDASDMHLPADLMVADVQHH